MNNIILFALRQAGFTEQQALTLVTICAATNNNLIAVEMLLGTYDKPALPNTSTIRLNAVLIDVNELHGIHSAVRFEYDHEETKWDASSRTDVKTGKVRKVENTCSVENWLSNQPVPTLPPDADIFNDTVHIETGN